MTTQKTNECAAQDTDNAATRRYERKYTFIGPGAFRTDKMKANPPRVTKTAVFESRTPRCHGARGSNQLEAAAGGVGAGVEHDTFGGSLHQKVRTDRCPKVGHPWGCVSHGTAYDKSVEQSIAEYLEKNFD